MARSSRRTARRRVRRGGLRAAAIVLPSVVISEVTPWGSGNSPYGADWFEVTNIGPGPVDVTGWKMDDDSGLFGSAVALNGITSIAPGESVIFMETSNPTAAKSEFLIAWFGGRERAGRPADRKLFGNGRRPWQLAATR